MTTPPNPTSHGARPEPENPVPPDIRRRLPLPNYTLSTVCPACHAPTARRACKVRCDRCGFMWDCSEL